MNQPIDTSLTREITGAPLKLLGLAALGVAMTAMSLWVAVDDGIGEKWGLIAALFGWFGTVFFGAATFISLKQMFTLSRVLITHSPEGLKDVRVSPAHVPWRVIRDVFTWEMAATKIMIVAVDEQFEAQMPLTRVAKMSRGANAKLGADGLAISAQGTKVGHDELMAWTIAYARDHGGLTAPRKGDVLT